MSSSGGPGFQQKAERLKVEGVVRRKLEGFAFLFWRFGEIFIHLVDFFVLICFRKFSFSWSFWNLLLLWGKGGTGKKDRQSAAAMWLISIVVQYPFVNFFFFL